MRNHSNSVSIIIPNWNGKRYLQTCLPAIVDQSYDDFEIILVDNGSVDGSIAYVKECFPNVLVVSFDTNQGFAAACNAGIMKSCAKFIVLLNNDTKPADNWLEALVGAIQSFPDDVACVSSKMVKMDTPWIIDDAGDTLTWRGGTFKRGHGKHEQLFRQREEIFSPCGGAALYRRTVLLEVGLFDEAFFAYLEDVDLGMRIRLAGYRCYFVPEAVVQHVGHGSGLPDDAYLYHISRNRLMMLFKNVPTPLLLKHSHQIAYGWIFYFFAFGLRKIYLYGTLAFLSKYPIVMKNKRLVMKKTRLGLTAIDRMVSSEWPEITLWTLFVMYMKHWLFRN
jgi:hypothetical protein